MSARNVASRIEGVPLIIALGIVGTVANIVLDFYPIPAVWRMVVRIAAGVVPAAIAAIGYSAADKRWRKSEEARADKEGVYSVSRVLEALVMRLFRGEQLSSVRANVMLTRGQELQIVAAWNMDAYPDKRLTLRRGQGVAGKTWERADTAAISECWKPVFAPSARLGTRKLRNEWGLEEGEIRATRHVLWILSTPIFHGVTRRPIGILNFDGVEQKLVDMTRLQQDDFHIKCVAAASLLSDDLAAAGLAS